MYYVRQYMITCNYLKHAVFSRVLTLIKLFLCVVFSELDNEEQ